MDFKIVLSRRRYRPHNKPLPPIELGCASRADAQEVCEALALHGGRFERIEVLNAATKGTVMFWTDEERIA